MALAYVSQPSRPLNEPQKFQGHHPLFEDRSNSPFSGKLPVISSKVASKSSSVHLGGHGMRKLGRPSGSKNKLKGSNYGPAKPGRHTLGHPDTRPVGGHLKKGLQLGSFPAEGLGDAPVGPPGIGPVGGHLQRGPLQGFFPTEGLGDAPVRPPGTGPVGGHLQRGPLQGSFPTERLEDAPVGPPGTGPVGGHLQRGPLQGHGGTNYEQKTPTGVNYPYRSPVQASISNQGPTGFSPHVYAQRGPLQSVAMPMHVSEGPVMTFGGLLPQGGHQMAHEGQLMTHGGQLMAHGSQKIPRRDAPMLHRGQPISNGGYPMQHGGLPMPRGDLVSPIQRMLDENAFLIRTISDFQNVGRNEETLHYQSMLHKNLMYLTGLAAEI